MDKNFLKYRFSDVHDYYYESLCDKLQIRELIYNPINILTNNFNGYNEDINLISTENFVFNEDFNEEDEDEDENINLQDDLLVTAQITNFFEDVNYILNIDSIDKDDLDDKFNEFLKNSSNCVQSIINRMFEFKTWNFVPLEKFIWIYLMIASKYEPRGLKYIMNSPFYTSNLLFKKDKYGYSPIFFAINNKYLDITILCDFIDLEKLIEIYFNNHHLFLYSALNTNTFLNILKKIPDSQKLIDYNNGINLMNPFLLACNKNPELALFLLDNGYITANIFRLIDDSFTCLMYSIPHCDLFKKLFNSEFNSIQLVNKKHPIFGNILSIAVKFNSFLVPFILNSKFMNKELYDGIIQYSSKLKSNILLETVNNIEMLESLLNNEHFDRMILEINESPVNVNVLNQICYNNSLILKILLEKNLIIETDFLKLDPSGMNLLEICIFHNDKNLGLLLNYSLLTKYLLSWKNLQGKNVIMIISEKQYFIILNELFNQRLIDDELLLLKDLEGYNTFSYICMFCPKIAIELLKKKKCNIFIEQQSVDGTLMLMPILFHINDSLLFRELINLIVKDEKTMNYSDQNGDNLFLQLCSYKKNFTKILLEEYDLIDEKLLCSNNNKYENCLNLIFNQADCDGTEFQLIDTCLELLINHKNMDKNILNSRNYCGQFPFLMACKRGYKSAKLIMECPLFDQESFSLVDYDGKNCFAFACNSGDLNLIKLICEHPLFTKEMFQASDNNYIPYILSALLCDHTVSTYILNNIFCDESLLKNTYKILMGRNLLNMEVINHVLNSQSCNSKILLLSNLEGNNSLILAIIENNFEIIQKILLTKNFSIDIFLQKNNIGYNCLYFVKSEDILKIILQSSQFTTDLMDSVCDKGYNVLQFYVNNGLSNFINIIIETVKFPINAIKYRNCNHESIILRLEEIKDLKLTKNILENLTSEDLLVQDKKSNTILHNLAKSCFNELEESYKSGIQNESIVNKIEIYLKNGKMSKELFEMKNKYGEIFFEKNIHLLKYILDTHCFNDNLLKEITVDNKTIIYKICFEYPKYLETILEHKSILPQVLYDDNPKYSLINDLMINSFQSKTIEIILRSKKCSNYIVNWVDYNGYTPLAYAILYKNNSSFCCLISSDYDLTPSFNMLYPKSINLLMLATGSTDLIFKLLINSKYVTHDQLLYNDFYKHNCVIYTFSSDLNKVEILTNSKVWDEKLMYVRDIDGDFLMVYPYNNPDIIYFLLKNKKCDKKMLNMQNNLKNTCGYYYARYNHTSFSHLLESHLCDEFLINSMNIYGETCLHACSQFNLNSLDKLIDSKYFDKELILKQNNKGENCFMVLLKNNANGWKKLFNKTYSILELYKQKNNKGQSLLMYAARYAPILVKKILKIKVLMKEELLGFRDNKNRTCHFYGAKYNPESIKYLLDSKFSQSFMLHNNHMDNGSCLTISAKYQPLALQYLLDWDLLDKKTLLTVYEKETFLEIGCRENAESVKYSIDSTHDLSELFDEKTYGKNILSIACKFQPDAVKYILESKYFYENLLILTTDRTCLDDAYDFQPMALAFLINSDKIDEKYFNKEDVNGYKLLNKIKEVFPQVQILKDINKINLIFNRNEISEPNNKSCNICFTYKVSVVFLPCGHTCCISCGFKLKTCHTCRSVIDERKQIYS